jgi:hypothetical protein
MNCCIAAATSWLSVLELEELEVVDDVLDVAVELPLLVLLPVAPICVRASRMELINPPPGGGGGGGGCDTSELASDVLVVSGKVLPVLLVVSSWASQLFMLEMLLIVISLAPLGLPEMSTQHRRPRRAHL